MEDEVRDIDYETLEQPSDVSENEELELEESENDQANILRKDSSTKSIVGFSVVGLLFLLGYSYVELIGWMYMTMGNTLVSLGLMAIFAFLLVGTSFLLPRVISSNSKFICKNNRRVFFVVIIILVFLASLLMSFVGVSHYAKVYNDRDKIQNLYDKGVSEARELYPTYDGYVKDRCDAYQKILTKAVKNKARNKQTYYEYVGKFPGSNDKVRIQNLTTSLQRTLRPTNDSVFLNYEKWLDETGDANLWNISFVSNVTAMDDMVGSCVSSLKELSGRYFHPGEEYGAFEFPQFTSNQELQSLLSEREFYVSWKSLLILLLTAFTLIMPSLRFGLRSTKDI